MSLAICAFCQHGNPAGAKYCNECASPLALKPCAVCDAVNTRSAAQCHRCHAAFVVPVTADTSTASIVEQAGETLEELRRQLAAASARATSFDPAPARPAIREARLAPGASPLPVQAGMSTNAAASVAPPRADSAEEAPSPASESSASADARAPEPAEAAPLDHLMIDDVANALPRGEHFITLDEARRSSVGDIALPPNAPVPETIVLRPHRRSPAVAIAVILLLLAVPLGVYAWRNPDQVQAWITQLAQRLPQVTSERSSADPPPVAVPAVPPTPSEPATVSSGPAAAPVSPDAPVSSVAPAEDSRGTASPTDASVVPTDPSPPASAALPSDAATAATAAAAGKAASAAAGTPGKSASSSRSRASASKSRPRGSATRPRSPSSGSGTRLVPPAPLDGIESSQ